jgi:hypothetical protein
VRRGGGSAAELDQHGYITRLGSAGVVAEVLREGGSSEVAVKELKSQMVMPGWDQVWASVHRTPAILRH